MTTLDNNKSFHTTEWSYYDFVQHAAKRELSKTFKTSTYKDTPTSRSTTKGKIKFTGTKSIDEAITFAYNGWDVGLKQLDQVPEIEGATNIPEFTPSMCGGAVNMGAYLAGQPDCMFDFKPTEGLILPERTLYVPLCFNGSVTSKTALKYANSAIKHINEMQVKYNLRIVLIIVTKFGTFRTTRFVVVKEFDQEFVLNSMTFAMHPSFLRRFEFAHLEAEEYFSGYGAAVRLPEVKQMVKKYYPIDDAFMMPEVDAGAFRLNQIKPL